MAKKRTFERTLLIVCEGTETEPKYFEYLRSISMENKIWSKIEIIPTPNIDEGITYEPNQRKKRNFNANTIVDNRFKDYTEEIYGKSDANAYYKENKPSYECGTGKNPTHDCKGKTCLVGYLRENYYKHFAKNQVFDRLGMSEIDFNTNQKIAFQNAVWLRYMVNQTNPSLSTYEKKPYTDVDYLVKSILGITMDNIYTELSKNIDISSIKNLSICFLNTNTIEFRFEEISSNPLGFDFYLVDNQKNTTKLTILENSFENILNNQKFQVVIPTRLPNLELHIKTENEILIVEI